MRFALRLAACVVVLFAAGSAIRYLCVYPHMYNIERPVIEASLQSLARRSRLSAARVLRLNLERLQFFERRYPIDVSIYVNKALIYVEFGDQRRGIAAWQKGMFFDKRPEMFLGMGLAKLELGLLEEAREDLLLAMRFNPDLRDNIEEYVSHPELVKELIARYNALYHPIGPH